MKMQDAKINQRVVVTTDVDLTGVKGGAIGRIIYIQDGQRGTGRSTDLAEHAIQVRFKAGAELWLRPEEIEVVPNDQQLDRRD